MARSVEDQMAEWVGHAKASGQCAKDTCHKCGKRDWGFFNMVEGTFTCLHCRAKEIFYQPKKLDVEDFAKV